MHSQTMSNFKTAHIEVGQLEQMISEKGQTVLALAVLNPPGVEEHAGVYVNCTVMGDELAEELKQRLITVVKEFLGGLTLSTKLERAEATTPEAGENIEP